MTEDLNRWVESFPREDIEREIADLLVEIDRLKEQVRHRREVLKIHAALEDAEGASATTRQVRTTKVKGRR